MRELEWGTAPAGAAETFDLILAADCVYKPELIRPLLEAAADHASPTTVLLLCGIVGSICIREFRAAVPRYFGRCEALRTDGEAAALADNDSGRTSSGEAVGGSDRDQTIYRISEPCKFSS